MKQNKLKSFILSLKKFYIDFKSEYKQSFIELDIKNWTLRDKIRITISLICSIALVIFFMINFSNGFWLIHPVYFIIIIFLILIIWKLSEKI